MVWTTSIVKLFSLCLTYKIRRPEQKREAQNRLKWCAVSGIYCCASREEKTLYRTHKWWGGAYVFRSTISLSLLYNVYQLLSIYFSIFILVYLSYVHFTKWAANWAVHTIQNYSSTCLFVQYQNLDIISSFQMCTGMAARVELGIALFELSLILV